MCIMFTMLDDIFCTKPKSMTMIIHLTRLGMNLTTWLSYKNFEDTKRTSSLSPSISVESRVFHTIICEEFQDDIASGMFVISVQLPY